MAQQTHKIDMAMSDSDCSKHSTEQLPTALSKAHSSHSETMSDCCGDASKHLCHGDDKDCSQSGCQCEHASSHVVNYVASAPATTTVKLSSADIKTPREITFSGYTTALLRPPIRFI